MPRSCDSCLHGSRAPLWRSGRRHSRSSTPRGGAPGPSPRASSSIVRPSGGVEGADGRTSSPQPAGAMICLPTAAGGADGAFDQPPLRLRVVVARGAEPRLEAVAVLAGQSVADHPAISRASGSAKSERPVVGERGDGGAGPGPPGTRSRSMLSTSGLVVIELAQHLAPRPYRQRAAPGAAAVLVEAALGGREHEGAPSRSPAPAAAPPNAPRPWTG